MGQQLTFEVQVDVCIAVTEGVECVAPVHTGVVQARVLDGQGQHVAMLLGLVLLRFLAFVADAGVLFDDLRKNIFWSVLFREKALLLELIVDGFGQLNIMLM